MDDQTKWKAIHCWPEEEEDSEFPEAPPIKTTPPWFSVSLQIYARHMVLADELEKAARESSDRHEKRRLAARANRARAKAQDVLRQFETELPEDFNPARYLHRCATER